MKSTITERTIVVALFILVLITFSLAQRDTKRLDRLYTFLFDKKPHVTVVQNETPVQHPSH